MKKLHSFLAVVLCLMLLFGAFPNVYAESAGNYEYIFKGDGSIELTKYNGDETDVVIPETLDGFTVTSIGWRTFHSYGKIKSLVVGNNITCIGEEAFLHCRNLSSITLAGSVEIIGKGAFSECYNLPTITFPEGVKVIGSGAFSGCEKLESIEFSSTVETIDNAAFSGTCITELTIPDSVKTIGGSAFFGSENLKMLRIGDGVEVIESHAFNMCRDLVTLELGRGVKEIGELAFDNCSSLSHIFYHGTEEEFNSIDGYLPSDALRHYESTDESVVFTETCNYHFAFCGLCNNYIHCRAKMGSGHHFEYGNSICGKCNTSEGLIYDPNEDLTSMYIHGFSNGCTDIIINSTIEGLPVTHIVDDAFYFSPEITSVTIADGIEYIGWRAFHTQSENLKKVTIYSRDCLIRPDANTLGDANYTTIYAYKDSTAESYAKKFGYRFVALEENENASKNPFTDVKNSDYFAEPVFWAVDNEITNGVTPTSFAPDALCTRGQVVTFLWRACGSPKPTSSDNPFVDVDTGDYYYKAVLWALEKGITTGVNKTRFGPHGVCTRGQVATFLWRAQGKPAIESSKNPFSDVSKNAYYFDAVLWAVENEITQGIGGGKFAPDMSCTRGQIVTFLYRAIA